jgi:chromosome segregation ATPase
MNKKKKKMSKKHQPFFRKDVPLENLKGQRDRIQVELDKLNKSKEDAESEKEDSLKDINDEICKEQVAVAFKTNDYQEKEKESNDALDKISELEVEISKLKKYSRQCLEESEKLKSVIDTAKLDELKQSHSNICGRCDKKISGISKNINKKIGELEKVTSRIKRREQKVQDAPVVVPVSPPDRGTGETFKREEEAVNE